MAPKPGAGRDGDDLGNPTDDDSSRENDDDDNDNEGADDDEAEEEGEQVRVSLRLSPEFRDSLSSLSSEEQERWRVSDAPLAVPSSLTRSGLSAVLRQLLLEQRQQYHHDDDGAPSSLSLEKAQFDFWIGGAARGNHSATSKGAKLLRGGVEAQARKHGLSLEEAVPLYYFPLRTYRPHEPTTPEPKLPDWISSVQYDPSSKVVIATCYDGSLHCYHEKKTRHAVWVTTEIAATRAASANAPLKCCAVQSQRDESSMVIATGGMDHTLRLHRLEIRRTGTDEVLGQVDPMAKCVGHLSSIESVAFAPLSSGAGDGMNATSRLASGEWNGGVCLWTVTAAHSLDDGEQPSDIRKKAKTMTTSASNSGHVKHDATGDISPIASLQAHAGNVSGLSFGNHLFRTLAGADPTADKLVTGSWDHTIKLWDVERQNNILTLNGSRVVSCLDTSYHTEGIVATGHPDCTLRLWDVRMRKDSSSSSLLTADQTTWRPSHRAWITGVSWSIESPYHLLSSSHDGTIKLWDLRASLPLQTLRITKGGTERDGNKILSAAFGNSDQRVYAGGTDAQLHSYDCS